MPGTELTRDVERVRRLATVLDSAIRVPGTRVRFGADALLGLVPGAGDAVGVALSAYPILIALRHGLPRTVVMRMLGNIGLDALVGTVPILGDLFDVGFKANVRNQLLIERFATVPVTTARRSRLAVWAAGAGIVVAVAALVALIIWLVSRGLSAITS